MLKTRRKLIVAKIYFVIFTFLIVTRINVFQYLYYIYKITVFIIITHITVHIDVSRQTGKFYAQANMLLSNFRYCSVDVKCMLFRSYCTNMYCCPLRFNSTSSSIKKLKVSYNGVLRRLLLTVKPYSASEMFVTYNIPSFYELPRKCIYSFRERISHSANKIIKACLSPIVFIHSPI